MEESIFITNTKKWIVEVVVGCNFCPFAAKEVMRNTIYYDVCNGNDVAKILKSVTHFFKLLNTDTSIETAFLILDTPQISFSTYLNLLKKAERLLKKEGYEGTYQIASFHPQYIFAGSNDTDPANYTNRSPYPMLHFLREDSVSKAVSSYTAINDITARNINFATTKGLLFMQQMLIRCKI